MMSRRRLLLPVLAIAAIAAPMPALASAAPPIHVSVANGGCRQAGTEIVCRLDVGFSQVAGAGSYSAEVIAPDGAITDHGAVGAPSTTLWVPYVGAGRYTVRIFAWAPGQSPAGP